MTQKITKTSVALGEKEREIVNNVRVGTGLNFSAALRMIIREWLGYEERYRITEHGRQALHENRENYG